MKPPSCLFTEWEPDPISRTLGSKVQWYRFVATTGLEGLALVNGKQLEILALFARCPHTGQFKRFINQAMLEFDGICIWEVWSDFLPGVLLRYGFMKILQTTDQGEQTAGFIWRKK